jgi:hypothetical protein
MFYGVQTQDLPYPEGVGPDLVVQTFRPQIALPSDASYSAEVQGLRTNFDCEIVAINATNVQQASIPWISVLAPGFVVDIDAGNCTIRNAIIAMAADHTYHHDPYATQNFQGRINNATCSDGVDNSLSWKQRPDHSNYTDQRILMTMADLRWVIDPDDVGKPEQNGDSWWVQDVKAVLCRPSYSLGTYKVDHTAAGTSSQDPISAKLTTNGTTTTPQDLSHAITQSVLTVFATMYLGTGGADYVLATNVKSFFQLLSAINNGSRQEAFMDPQLLLDLGASAWKGVSSQIVYEYLTVSNDDIMSGSIYYTESRLQVKLLATVLMAVTLGLLCGTALVIMMNRPRDVTSCDPTSTLAKAAIFSASPTVMETIAVSSLAKLCQVQETVRHYTFQSKSTRNSMWAFHVEVIPSDALDIGPSPSEEHQKDDSVLWWRPMATQHWFLCIAVLLPVLVIAILELLQHISEAKQGLVAANPGSTLSSQVLSHYLPAAVMLVVGALFTSIRDTAAIFAPYSKLKSGEAHISCTAHSLIGRMTAHAILLSAKCFSIGHVISLLASLVVPFLTIVASGLYTATSVTRNWNTTLTLSDRFNFTQGDISISDNGAAVVTNLIAWSNLSFPDWTYQDLVFNKVVAKDPLPNAGLMLVDIPAYRAKLDCNVPLYDSYETSIYGPIYLKYPSPQPNMTAITVQRTLPMPCLQGVANTNVTWEQHFWVPDDHTPNYVGKASMIQWGLSSTPMSNTNQSLSISGSDGGVYPAYFDPEGESPAVELSIGGYSCPSFGITIGSASLVDGVFPNGTRTTAATSDLAFLMCFQRLEQVQTRVAFNLPELSINTTVPPQPDESTAVAVNNSALLDGIWEWPINTLLTSLMVEYVQSTSIVAAPPGGDPAYNNLDPFLDTIVAGQPDVPITDLLGGSQQALDTLFTASQLLYGVYMAQAISANMRNTTSLPSTSIPAQIVDVPVWRLQQNRDSKIALQAMLGFLAVSAILIYMFLDTRNVLPHNPCSLAGVATLLLGSELLTRDVMPIGAEWVPVEQLQRLPTFQDLRFYLGWKQDSEGVQHEDSTFGIFLESRLL